ncbi:MAG TPA: Zn-dependent alcohol dehydrogenase [Acidimicrobiales bacterium]|jgi:S-(hydroxymethyl)glutathione dehydrogenase/alcohol dehydrogenase|nr:Zn-dependent alcohol dehydrogenase [Acidimicrobiales bacterium]
MRAAIFVGQDQDLSVEDVTAIEPGARDVVVRIDASGVCHSDLSIMDGKLPVPPPLILGHEGSGTVERVGAEVARVKPGDRVILSLTPVCGACWHCLRHETHLCEMGSGVTRTPRAVRADGSQCGGLSGLGTFADVIAVHEASCIPVRTDLPAEQLALIGCGITTGLGAALNTAAVYPGATVAVIGCGGVGQSIIQGARIAGAAQIIAVDPVELKRQAAAHFGATGSVDPSEGDPVQQVLELSGGRGVDFAFEAVGHHDLIVQALNMTRKGGTTVLVGVPHYTTTVAVPIMPLIIQDKSIKGSYYGSSRTTRDFPRFIQLIETGRLDLDAMVSRRLALDDVNEAFRAMQAGEVLRSVLVP